MTYLLFAGDDYYPRGGAYDFQGKFDTLEQAISGHDPNKYDYDGGWANIFCVEELKTVKCFEDGKWINPDELPLY